MNVVYNKRDYILPFKKYLNKPKKSVSFEQKVEYEYTYGKDAYDRKPIENVEQVTLRELYELTLSRIEARKSNVYYSNQAPKDDFADITEYLNNDKITEENKIDIISKVEQEKINNMEVDELEFRSKNTKKIKLDFNKANQNEDDIPPVSDICKKEVENENNNNTYDLSTIETNSDNAEKVENDNEKMTELSTEESLPIKVETSGSKTENVLSETEQITTINHPPHDIDNYENSIEPVIDINRPPQGREVYLPNGEINYKNLPDTFVSPKRLDSKNRRGAGSGFNSPLDLAHYKPPLKSLAEINDPDYEKNIGKEPVPYGSNVVYEEPELQSPNLEYAIPVYNRPLINYRNNLMNITYNNAHPNAISDQTPMNDNVHPNTNNTTTSPKINNTKILEEEKKKDKKNNRKSLSFFHILKKSKSAETMKGKGRMSLFKPATKSNSESHAMPLSNNNNDSNGKSNPQSPLSHNIPNTLPLNDTLDKNNSNMQKNHLNRVSIFNNYQEPTINNLVSEGPGFYNNENRTLSKYALKTLKLRQSDSSLQVNTSELRIHSPGSPTHYRQKTPISAKSSHSSHSNHSSQSGHTNPSVQKPVINTYVPNIPNLD